MEEIADEIREGAEKLAEAAEGHHKKWHQWVALTTMMFALLAAIGGLLAGMSAQQALRDRTNETIDIVALQAKLVQAEVLRTKIDLLEANGHEVEDEVRKRLGVLERDIDELEEASIREEEDAEGSTEAHEHFAASVTLLGIASSLCGLAVLADRRWPWYAGFCFAALGLTYFGLGMAGYLGA